MKRRYVPVLLILGGIIAGAIAAELVCGYYLNETPSGRDIRYLRAALDKGNSGLHPHFQHDDEVGVVLKPLSRTRVSTSEFTVDIAISAQGMRDKELSRKKPQGEFRVLVAGESNVFGEGVNYGFRFTEVAEQALEDAEFLNMGIPGYGMDQSLLLLKRDGFTFDPDAVVLFIFGPDYLGRCKNITMSGQCNEKPRFVFSADTQEFVLQDIPYIRSHYCDELSFCQAQAVKDESRPAREPDRHSGEARMSHSSLVRLLDYNIKRYGIGSGPVSNPRPDLLGVMAWQKQFVQGYTDDDLMRLIVFLIGEYAKACREHDADLVVVNGWGGKFEIVERACKDYGIPYLDLSDVLREASKSYELLFVSDPHYNGTFHRLVGEHLSRFFLQRYDLKARRGFTYRYLNTASTDR